MATAKATNKNTPAPQKKKYIDPIYKKYTERVIKTIASTEFYEFFIENIERGVNEFQFSNRKLEKSVDETWVVAVEDCMAAFQAIIMNPRNYIKEEEEIVNVAVARQATPDVIRHLTTHGSMIDEVTDDNVRPNRLMTKFKEDNWNTYENRFVYTLLEKTIDFVNKRYEAIFANIGDEYGAFLKMHSETATYAEKVKADIDIRIRENEDVLSADGKHEDIFSRIARLHRLLGTYAQSTFAKQMAKYPRVKNPIVRTNAIQKNPNFKACYKLWTFIYNYKDIGYQINIYEQSNEITPSFQRDIYHSILFSYIILKNYLENPEDREIDMNRKFKKRKLQPKYITQVVEEIVKNYDLPDVEIRKVLIEELTKAQLMKEEAEERRRLVEEQQKALAAKRKEEEKEKARLAKEQEKEKRRIQKEKEKEKARKEKEAKLEAERLRKEKERKEALDLKRGERYMEELKQFELDRVAMVEQITKAEEAERARLEKIRLAEEAKRERERKAAEAKVERERLAAEAKAERERQEAIARAEREKRMAEEAAAREARRIELEKVRQQRIIEEEQRKLQRAKEAEERRIRKEQEAAAKEQRLIELEKIRLQRQKEQEELLARQAAEAEERRIRREKELAEEELHMIELERERAQREKELEEIQAEQAREAAEHRIRMEKEAAKAEARRLVSEQERMAKLKEDATRQKELERIRLMNEMEEEARRLRRLEAEEQQKVLEQEKERFRIEQQIREEEQRALDAKKAEEARLKEQEKIQARLKKEHEKLEREREKYLQAQEKAMSRGKRADGVQKMASKLRDRLKGRK